VKEGLGSHGWLAAIQKHLASDMQDIMMDGNQMEQVFVNQKPDWGIQSATALFAITGEPSSVQSRQGEGARFLIKILFTHDGSRIPMHFKANEPI